MAIDEIERTAMVQQLISTLGEESTATLMKCVLPDGAAQLATKEDLARFATKEDLARFATKEDLARFATKDDLTRFATKDDLARFATKEDVIRIVDERIAASEERMKEYVRVTVNSAVSQAIAKQTRWIAAMMTAFTATVVSALIAVGLS